MCPWHMTDRGHSQSVISGRAKDEGICGMDHYYRIERYRSSSQGVTWTR